MYVSNNRAVVFKVFPSFQKTAIAYATIVNNLKAINHIHYKHFCDLQLVKSLGIFINMFVLGQDLQHLIVSISGAGKLSKFTSS